jgi:hypothetical protein
MPAALRGLNAVSALDILRVPTIFRAACLKMLYPMQYLR